MIVGKRQAGSPLVLPIDLFTDWDRVAISDLHSSHGSVE